MSKKGQSWLGDGYTAKFWLSDSIEFISFPNPDIYIEGRVLKEPLQHVIFKLQVAQVRTRIARTKKERLKNAGQAILLWAIWYLATRMHF